jgi:hypothetical protein
MKEHRLPCTRMRCLADERQHQTGSLATVCRVPAMFSSVRSAARVRYCKYGQTREGGGHVCGDWTDIGIDIGSLVRRYCALHAALVQVIALSPWRWLRRHPPTGVVTAAATMTRDGMRQRGVGARLLGLLWRYRWPGVMIEE